MFAYFLLEKKKKRKREREREREGERERERESLATTYIMRQKAEHGHVSSSCFFLSLFFLFFFFFSIINYIERSSSLHLCRWCLFLFFSHFFFIFLIPKEKLFVSQTPDTILRSRHVASILFTAVWQTNKKKKKKQRERQRQTERDRERERERERERPVHNQQSPS